MFSFRMVIPLLGMHLPYPASTYMHWLVKAFVLEMMNSANLGLNLTTIKCETVCEMWGLSKRSVNTLKNEEQLISYLNIESLGDLIWLKIPLENVEIISKVWYSN